MNSKKGNKILEDKFEYIPFEDPLYAHRMQELIANNLKKGNNVLSMQNGDLIVIKTKVTRTLYQWDKSNRKLKLVKNK